MTDGLVAVDDRLARGSRVRQRRGGSDRRCWTARAQRDGRGADVWRWRSLVAPWPRHRTGTRRRRPCAGCTPRSVLRGAGHRGRRWSLPITASVAAAIRRRDVAPCAADGPPLDAPGRPRSGRTAGCAGRVWSANCGWARIRSPRSKSRPARSTDPSRRRAASGRGASPAGCRRRRRASQLRRSQSTCQRTGSGWRCCWRLAQAHGLAIATLMRAAHRDIVERERFSARGRRPEWRVRAPPPRSSPGCRCSASVSGSSSAQTRCDSCCPAVSGGWLLVIGVDARLLRAAVVGPHHRSGADMIAAVPVGCRAAGRRRTGAGSRPRGSRRCARRLPRRGRDVGDPLAVASTLDVFAACLSSGMAVAAAAAATAPSAPVQLGEGARTCRRPAGARRRSR